MAWNVGFALLAVFLINSLIFLVNPHEMSSDRQPPLTPPGYVIGMVWTGLFICMGLARWKLVGSRDGGADSAAPIVWLGILCLVYPVYTGGLRNETIGLIGNVVTLVFTLGVIAFIFPRSRAASSLDRAGCDMAHLRYVPNRAFCEVSVIGSDTRSASRQTFLMHLLALIILSGTACAQTQTVQVIVKADQNSIPRGPGELVVEPMSLKRKLQYYSKGSFSPVSLLIPALPAAIVMADPPRRYPREWRDGAEAFGRNFGDCLTTELAANSGRFIAGAITHEDPRYYPDQARSVAHRTWHAVAFTLVDRNDHGRPVLAISNLVGAASAGFVGRAYLPDGYNDLVHAGQRSGGSPELKKFARKLRLPFVPKD